MRIIALGINGRHRAWWIRANRKVGFGYRYEKRRFHGIGEEARWWKWHHIWLRTFRNREYYAQHPRKCSLRVAHYWYFYGKSRWRKGPPKVNRPTQSKE